MSDIYQVTTRRARKPHRCIECRRKIAAGETYHQHHGIFVRPFSEAVCVRCDEIRDEFNAQLPPGYWEEELSHLYELRDEICETDHPEWRAWFGLSEEET